MAHARSIGSKGDERDLQFIQATPKSHQGIVAKYSEENLSRLMQHEIHIMNQARK